MVLGGADQAAEALSQLDRRLGDLVVHERVTAVFADAFDAGFQQRVIRDTERQLGDDDVLQGIARDIDTLPETFCSEEHRTLFLLESIEQLGAVRSVSLTEQCHILLHEPAGQSIGTLLEGPIACEQYERPALGFEDVLLDPRDEGFIILGRLGRRIGHLIGQHQTHLLAIVKWASEFQLRGLRQPQPRAQESKVLLANGERRAGQDDTRHLCKQLISKYRPDIDRRTHELQATVSPRRFDPVDGVLDFLFQPRAKRESQTEQPIC